MPYETANHPMMAAYSTHDTAGYADRWYFSVPRWILPAKLPAKAHSNTGRYLDEGVIYSGGAVPRTRLHA